MVIEFRSLGVSIGFLVSCDYGRVILYPSLFLCDLCKGMETGYTSLYFSAYVATCFSHLPRSDGGSLWIIGLIALGKLRL